MRLAIALALLAGTLALTEQAPRIDRNRLLGAWTSGGETFEFVIGDETILYEFDMRQHPYTLEGNVLVIDFEDPVLGIQRKEILRLTDEELELRDVETGDTPTVFRRVE